METRIYVGNLPDGTTENELKKLFTKAGAVASVMLMTDHDSGKTKGFASIEMKDEAGANNAVKMFDGEIFGKRQLKVILAWHRKGFGSSGFSRGGGYGTGRPGGGYGPGRPKRSRPGSEKQSRN